MAAHLLIRADASNKVGTGHVMRSIALAQAWQREGGRVSWVQAQSTPQLKELLCRSGFQVTHISDNPGSIRDAVSTASLACKGKHDWVAIDGYHFGADYQHQMKKSGLSLLVVDDCVHAEHYWADLILNQNLHASEGLYKKREPYTDLLLGPKYALLRREFQHVNSWKREIPRKVHRVLVTLGGADYENVTKRVVRCLSGMRHLECVVALGGSNTHLHLLQPLIYRSSSCLRFVIDAPNMSELMSWADVAISAAGSTAWELACTGLPSILIVLADNQIPIAAELHRRGICVNLGWHNTLNPETLINTLNEVVSCPRWRRVMSQRGRSLVDGFGSDRVVARLRTGKSHI